VPVGGTFDAATFLCARPFAHLPHAALAGAVSERGAASDLEVSDLVVGCGALS